MHAVEERVTGRVVATAPPVTDTGALVKLFFITFFVIVLVRTAWMCDDAYITLRAVDNLVAGYGPRWNVVERVQSYTHPLWMLLLALFYAVTHEAYFTSLIVSIALSAAAVWLFLTRLASSWQTVTIGGAVLLFSKAFVEYCTSGLENPLTYFLLALFLMMDVRRKGPDGLVWIWLLAGLMMVNRLDIGLLVMPVVLARSWRAGWRPVRLAAVVGLAPVIGWEIFSIVYYGFPFPNTAYAKLQTGVGAGPLVAQGLLYLVDSVAHDPVTLLAIVVFTAASLAARAHAQWPYALGTLLYIAYVVRIGGDFMSGRFLSVPLFWAVATFAQLPWRLPRPALTALLAGLTLLGVLATTRPPITSGPTTFASPPPQAIGASGISDERAFYYGDTGLLRWSRQLPLPETRSVARGRELRAAAEPQVIAYPQVGFLGYFAGPAVHVIDEYALGDPLLARLPAQPNWRIGHYLRTVPEGYLETVRTGRNAILDADTAILYDRLKLITQGSLWSRRRWRAIAAMNLGR